MNTPSLPESPKSSPSWKRASRPSSVVVETLGAKTSETKDGRKINNYLLKKEIGHGAFGTVHLGVDTTTNIEYAIKEFSKSRLRRQEQMARFRRPGPRGPQAQSLKPTVSSNPLDLVRVELAILKKLNHPHVVKLYEVLDDPENDSLYMVFEMAHKGTLMNVELEHTAKPYSVDEARRFFREMILGIEYLHNNEVVHRDIKPDNLLLSDDNVLKIVDFGVSEMFDKGNDRMKKSAGSPAFMAPELCAPKHGDISGKAADIWSMGVSLYCLVYGHLPFISNNVIELMEKIRTDEPEYGKETDPDLIDLFHRLLDKNPDTRITIADLRNHDWVTCRGTMPMISVEENCQTMVTEVTEDDYNNAISSISGVFAVIKAVSILKRHSRSLSQNSNQTDNTPKPKENFLSVNYNSNDTEVHNLNDDLKALDISSTQ